jgi:hypothetical protein
MKTLRRTLALTATLLLCPALVQAHEPVKSLSVDLNGDGKPESIQLRWREGDPTYVLQAGSVSIQGRGDERTVEGVTVIDLDTREPTRELVVHVTLPLDERRMDLYGFDGKALRPLGSVPAITQTHGNGILLSDDWWGFWTRRDKYVLNREQWRLERVRQPYYYVGQEARVLQSFPLAFDRTGAPVVAHLAPDSTIQVLAADTSIPGQYPWFLVKSSTGLLGWAEGQTLVRNTQGLPAHATQVP